MSQTIEVECHHCDERGQWKAGACLICGGRKVIANRVAPGTRTEARLRLADAAEAYEIAFDDDGVTLEQFKVAQSEYQAAVAALRKMEAA